MFCSLVKINEKNDTCIVSWPDILILKVLLILVYDLFVFKESLLFHVS